MVYTGRIYRIDNIENKNFYIGQTYKTLSQRFTNHKCEAKRGNVDGTLYRAIRKYGKEFFTIEDIEIKEFETKQDAKVWMNEREPYYISTLKPAYNAAPGGLGHTGVPWTEERRARFKERMSGPNNPNFGKPCSEETKQKLSESLKGRVISEETREKTSQTMKGVPKTEETRKKMSESRKGREMPKGKDSKKAVAIDQFDLEENFLKTFGSLADAAAELGCKRSGICFALKGRIKTSAGYIWKYSNSTCPSAEQHP
jgi:group I intron endonuclease